MNKITDTIEYVIIAMIITANLIWISWIWYTAGYKSGQIDAINGKVHYELKQQDDGATEWEIISRKDE